MAIAKVNGVEVEFEPGLTVLQVAELAGEEIPRFCYHERLSIAGNCRMCLVEVKPGPPKPQASCALPAMDGQEIFTNTPMVKKAREGVMEFLLANHPLDCPICDQGGECDLQDQAMGYGRDGSRFSENKRAVEEKNFGPTIKTFMTRCIQCTRCVRFTTEVAGVTEMGLTGRGESVEISPYLEEIVTSELSGNVNDLCPVGALTHKPWSYNYRPWELQKVETIDVHDALGANIRIDYRGAAVFRALPRLNDAVNEEWISDKSRYAVDGLQRQRLDRPFIRQNGKLAPATWSEALDLVASKIKAAPVSKTGLIAGDLQDAEGMKAALDLFRALGIANTDCRQDGSKLGAGQRETYLFNSGLAGIEKADAVLLIGTNPRLEAPVLNARFRKIWLSGQTKFAVIGEAADLTFDYQHLGTGPKAIEAFDASGFASVFKSAKAPAIVVGSGALTREDSLAVMKLVADLSTKYGVVRDGWNGFNVLHTAASRVAGLDLGFVPSEGGLDTTGMTKAAEAGALDVVVLLGADELPLTAFAKSFVVYVGSHGDAGAQAADVVLPASAYTEKSGLYVNTEGRVQLGQRAVFPKGEAKEDWAIFRALSERLGKTLSYDTLADLRARLMQDTPSFGRIDYVSEAHSGLDLTGFGAAGAVSDAAFESPIKDFYLTNPIARASVAMADCSKARHGVRALATAAE